MRSSFIFNTNPYLQAITCMIASTLFFSLMNMLIRHVSADLHTTVIVFLRNVLAVAFMLPWVIIKPKEWLGTQRLGAHFVRATVGIIGMQSWFYCVATLPLNQATALSFTAPLFNTILAWLVFRERVDAAHIWALLAGFLGTLVILKPDPNHLEWASLVVLFTTAMWATAGMMVKSLTTTESSSRIVFYMALFMALWAAPPAMYFWQPPTAMAWLCIAGIALLSTAGHWYLVQSFRLGAVASIMPFDYFRLLFTALFAYLFFDEVSDINTWLGAAIILASAVFIARRDIARRDANIADPT